MTNDKKKLFVGGLVKTTTADSLKLYFSSYGVVESCSVYFNRNTGIFRGFGFVSFFDLSSVENALQHEHVIDGKKVQVNVARPRIEPQQTEGFNSNVDGSKKKIFAGGLAHTITHEEFRTYFLQFGAITDAVVVHDKSTNLSRGFGFITFASGESFTRATQCRFHKLGDKLIDVKPAIPKEFFSTYDCNGFSSGLNYGGWSPTYENGSQPNFYGYNLYDAPQNYVPMPSYSQNYSGYDDCGCYVGPQHRMLDGYNRRCCFHSNNTRTMGTLPCSTSYASEVMVKTEVPPICNKITELEHEESDKLKEVVGGEITSDDSLEGERDVDGQCNGVAPDDPKVEKDIESKCEDVDYQDDKKQIQTILIDNSDLHCKFLVMDGISLSE